MRHMIIKIQQFMRDVRLDTASDITSMLSHVLTALVSFVLGGMLVVLLVEMKVVTLASQSILGSLSFLLFFLI